MITPTVLVLRSSSWLAALGEEGKGRLAAKPSAHNDRKSHAGRREECAHVYVFGFLCVSFRSWL